LETNPGLEVQAHACFALATLLKKQADEKSDVAAGTEAENLFERIITKYDKVKSDDTTLAARAERELSELRNFGIGKIAPEIEGEDLDGRKMKLSDYRGRVVVLNFWGTWCSSCMEMVPEERKLVQSMTGKPFALLGVNSEKNSAKLKSIMEREQMTWRSFRDDSTQGPISTAWRIQSWPATFILDHKGIIRYRNVSAKDLARKVAILLAEQSHPAP
jgi:peroxiredoxin